MNTFFYDGDDEPVSEVDSNELGDDIGTGIGEHDSSADIT